MVKGNFTVQKQNSIIGEESNRWVPRVTELNHPYNWGFKLGQNVEVIAWHN